MPGIIVLFSPTLNLAVFQPPCRRHAANSDKSPIQHKIKSRHAPAFLNYLLCSLSLGFAVDFSTLINKLNRFFLHALLHCLVF